MFTLQKNISNKIHHDGEWRIEITIKRRAAEVNSPDPDYVYVLKYKSREISEITASQKRSSGGDEKMDKLKENLNNNNKKLSNIPWFIFVCCM